MCGKWTIHREIESTKYGKNQKENMQNFVFFIIIFTILNTLQSKYNNILGISNVCRSKMRNTNSKKEGKKQRYIVLWSFHCT